MYLLTFVQEETETKVGVFETLEQGRAFAKTIPGYTMKEEDGFEYEFIDPKALPLYTEVESNGHIVPFTRYMFPEDTEVEMYWYEIPNLSMQGGGMVDDATRVDAYFVNNAELKNYITQREEKYEKVKALLSAQGYAVDRAFYGSQDGEAIMYKHPDKTDWYFLCHMDPGFVEECDVQALLQEIA